jgi:hypothetical protein
MQQAMHFMGWTLPSKKLAGIDRRLPHRSTVAKQLYLRSEFL